MPKAFSSEQKLTIRQSLIAAGKRIINTRGIRSLTIDELARAAGIAKGSFYSFFPSREDCILTIFESWEDQYRGALLTALTQGEGDATTRLEQFFLAVPAMLEAEPGLASMGSADLATLMAALPPERLAAHQSRDREVLDAAMKILVSNGVVAATDIDLLHSLTMAFFTLSLHRREMEDQVFHRTVGFLAHASARELSRRSAP